MRKRIFSRAFSQESREEHVEKRLHMVSNDTQNPPSAREEFEKQALLEKSRLSEENLIDIPQDLLKLMVEVLERKRQLQNLLPLLKDCQTHMLNERARSVRLLDGIPFMLDFCNYLNLSEAHYASAWTRESSLEESIDIIDIHLARQDEFVDKLTHDLRDAEQELLVRTNGLLQSREVPLIPEQYLNSDYLIASEELNQWEADLAGLRRRKDAWRVNADRAQCGHIECLVHQLKNARNDAQVIVSKLVEARNYREFRFLTEQLHIKEEEIAEIAEELSLRGKPHGSTGSPVALSTSSMAITIGSHTFNKIMNRTYQPDPETEDERYLTAEEAERAHKSTLNWIENVEEPVTGLEDQIASSSVTDVEDEATLREADVVSDTGSCYGSERAKNVVERSRIDAWTSRSARAFFDLPEEAKSHHARAASTQDEVNISARV